MTIAPVSIYIPFIPQILQTTKGRVINIYGEDYFIAHCLIPAFPED